MIGVLDKLKGAWLGWTQGYAALAMSAVPGFKDGRIHFLERRCNPFRDRRSPSRRTTVVLFDIDNLKLVNDKLGYEAGNLVLELFGRVCGMYFRREAEKVRLGGDEFALEIIGPPYSWVEVRVKAVQTRFRFQLQSIEFLAEILSVAEDTGAAEVVGQVGVSAGISQDLDEAELHMKKEKTKKTFSYR